jgi:UDP-glucose 6-dehydrogenase
MKIGIIGQGFVGSSYSDYFEGRGFSVIRYDISRYRANAVEIKRCAVVIIAVPTPTEPAGVSLSAIDSSLSVVSKDAIVIIKSTMPPGTTKKLKSLSPELSLFHSPEFLSRDSANNDLVAPERSIVGVTDWNPETVEKAKYILDLLPKANYELICDATEAEVIKYGSAALLYSKILVINLLFEIAGADGAQWPVIREALSADPRLGIGQFDPHHKGGHGAGGSCLLKDFAALRLHYEHYFGPSSGTKLLKAMEDKNVELLLSSNKDVDEVCRVYGQA